MLGDRNKFLLGTCHAMLRTNIVFFIIKYLYGLNLFLKKNNLRPKYLPPPVARLFFIEAGNTSDSYPTAITLDTKMTVELLQELLLALQANDAECFKEWLVLGLERLGRLVINELMQEWMSSTGLSYSIPIKY